MPYIYPSEAGTQITILDPWAPWNHLEVPNDEDRNYVKAGGLGCLTSGLGSPGDIIVISLD